MATFSLAREWRCYVFDGNTIKGLVTAACGVAEDWLERFHLERAPRTFSVLGRLGTATLILKKCFGRSQIEP